MSGFMSKIFQPPQAYLTVSVFMALNALNAFVLLHNEILGWGSVAVGVLSLGKFAWLKRKRPDA